MASPGGRSRYRDVVFVRVVSYQGPHQHFEEPIREVASRGDVVNLRNVALTTHIEARDDHLLARSRRRGQAPGGGSARCIITQLP